jgi:hypothetical protein
MEKKYCLCSKKGKKKPARLQAFFYVSLSRDIKPFNV